MISGIQKRKRINEFLCCACGEAELQSACALPTKSNTMNAMSMYLIHLVKKVSHFGCNLLHVIFSYE